MNKKKLRFAKLLFSINIFLLCQLSTADVQSINSSINLPNASNTNYECVKLARLILNQNKKDGLENIPELIKCLEGDYFYFDRGAAKIALSYIGQPAVTHLIHALSDSRPKIAEGAAIALGMIGSDAREAVPVLKDIIRQKQKLHTDIMLKNKAAIALAKIGEIDFLIRALQGKEEKINPYTACIGLGAAGPKAAPAVPTLLKILNSPDNAARMYAADALGEIGPAASSAVPRLEELSNSSLNFVRRAAGEALLKIGTPEAKEAAKFYAFRKKLFADFFSLMSIFMVMPWLAILVGIGIGIIAFYTMRKNEKKKYLPKVLYATAIFWIFYAAWEYYSHSIGANIRVDLLIIYPVLFGLTLFSLIFWLVSLMRSKSRK